MHIDENGRTTARPTCIASQRENITKGDILYVDGWGFCVVASYGKSRCSFYRGPRVGWEFPKTASRMSLEELQERVYRSGWFHLKVEDRGARRNLYVESMRNLRTLLRILEEMDRTRVQNTPMYYLHGLYTHNRDIIYEFRDRLSEMPLRRRYILSKKVRDIDPYWAPFKETIDRKGREWIANLLWRHKVFLDSEEGRDAFLGVHVSAAQDLQYALTYLASLSQQLRNAVRGWTSVPFCTEVWTWGEVHGPVLVRKTLYDSHVISLCGYQGFAILDNNQYLLVDRNVHGFVYVGDSVRLEDLGLDFSSIKEGAKWASRITHVSECRTLFILRQL